jgi:hypothetical protein
MTNPSQVVDVAKLLAIVTWLAMHRVLLNRGFLVTRSRFSTDTLCSIGIGCTAIVWTIVVLCFQADGDAPRSRILRVLDKLSQTPVLILIISLFWLVLWLDGIVASNWDYANFHFWNLRSIDGPFDWISSLNPIVYGIMCGTLLITIVPLSITAIACGAIMRGILLATSLVIFLISGTGKNPYNTAPHRYSSNMLRIALPTSHHEGTTYILPSAFHGFSAVWSPKVPNEHLAADTFTMTLFQSMRSGAWNLKEPLESIRSVVSAYQERAVLSPSQISGLAHWLYLDDSRPGTEEMRRIRCERAKGVHLIGRDLMYALCHAEYLVFMAQASLPDYLRAKIGMLRLMKRSGGTHSGAGSGDIDETVGFKQGFAGYREAVEYIYELFDSPVDSSALDFSGTSPPAYSVACSKPPTSIDAYVSELWDLCCEHSESTFTALYMFATVWFIEVGNVNGFHIFPLRCKNRNGDLVSFQIVWRQALYSGVVAQLIAMSSVLFAAFVAGILV